MTRGGFAEMHCSVARTLDVVGERWSLLILRDAFNGIHRFDAFQASLGIARNILADRLAKLVEHGVLERRRYAEHPPRDEYRLTAKGRALFDVLMAMVHWGDTWESEGAEPPVTITHEGCGAVMHAVPACSNCGQILTPWNVRTHPARTEADAGVSA
ncbi:MAG: transcriptional regulator [Actinobacteria bacterium]|nr:MAG: transcriptional regulator [Actinomycetota bacterium]